MVDAKLKDVCSILNIFGSAYLWFPMAHTRGRFVASHISARPIVKPYVPGFSFLWRYAVWLVRHCGNRLCYLIRIPKRTDNPNRPSGPALAAPSGPVGAGGTGGTSGETR
jgi:hypothetical protein